MNCLQAQGFNEQAAKQIREKEAEHAELVQDMLATREQDAVKAKQLEEMREVPPFIPVAA